jgi:hypothetical protein
MGTGGDFPGGWSGRGVKLTTHLHLVPWVSVAKLDLHSLSSSWRGGQLIKPKDSFTLYYPLQRGEVRRNSVVSEEHITSKLISENNAKYETSRGRWTVGSVPVWLALGPSSWRWYFPPKYRAFSEMHNVIIQNTALFKTIALRPSNSRVLLLVWLLNTHACG